jgi:hypothetical protein
MRPVRIITALVFATLVGPLTLGVTPAQASEPTIQVRPSSVTAGDTVVVSGSVGPAPAGSDCATRVTLISKAFTHTHDFAGLPAVVAAVQPGGAFTVTTTIPRSTAAGTYSVSGRCGGGNLGVSATLVVRAATANTSLVALGRHQFGRLRTPETVVARAGANQVGFHRQQEGISFGPWAFDIAPDGSVWLLDQVNNRLLAWQPGRPDQPTRTVPLPFKTGIGLDLVVGADGTMYVSTLAAQDPDYLYALSPSGQVRWRVLLPTDQVAGYLLRGTDGRVWYHYHEPALAWAPLTDPAGRPLAAAERRRLTSPHQPVGGGQRLVTASPSSHERRFTLIDSAGQPVRAWRVTSQTELGALVGEAALVGGDLAVTLEVSQQTASRFLYEYLVLRLAPSGAIRQRFALDARAVWGEKQAELRVGRDGRLYQLGTSPPSGARIARYSLDPVQPAPPTPTPPTPTPAPAPPAPTVPTAANPPVTHPDPATVPETGAPTPAAAGQPASRWLIAGLVALGGGLLAGLVAWRLYRARSPLAH